MSITSKYFCTKRTHDICKHDWDPETDFIHDTIIKATTNNPFSLENEMQHDDKDALIMKLKKELADTKETSEAYWQRYLQNELRCTSMKREILSHHRFVTDLSNAHFLVEIKNQKDYRTAVGQIFDYIHYKRENGDRIYFTYIILFGSMRQWNLSLWRDRVRFCESQGITLRCFC